MLLGCDFSSHFQRQILEAQNLIKNQNYQEAAKLYEEILLKNPLPLLKIKIYYQLGNLYSIYLDQRKRALLYFEKMIGESNDPFWLVKAQEKIGDIQFQYEENYDESIKHYLSLTQFTPRLESHDFYEFRLGESYLKAGKTDLAIDIFKKVGARKNHQYYLDGLFNLGMAHFYKKEWLQAIQWWTLYVKNEKKSERVVEAKFLMANAYETLEMLDEAYNKYYELLGFYPNSDVIKNRLKSLYARRKARKR